VTRSLSNTSFVLGQQLAATSMSDINAVMSNMKATEGLSYFSQVKELILMPMWTSLVFCLCALFFVVTGIQIWATAYFENAFEKPAGLDMKAWRQLMMGSFVAVAATGPVVGLIVGGLVVETSFVGGYKTRKGQFRTCVTLVLIGILATVCGIVGGWTTSFGVCVVFMWLLLFFGGAIVPGATGMVIALVRQDMKTFSAGLSMAVQNVFGYALGAYLPSFLIRYVFGGGPEATDEEKSQAYINGIRVLMLWAIWGLLFCLMAVIFSYRNYREEQDWWKHVTTNPNVDRKTTSLKTNKSQNGL
jgi:MFS family permease